VKDTEAGMHPDEGETLPLIAGGCTLMEVEVVSKHPDTSVAKSVTL